MPIVHSSLFHDKKQGARESIDQYAQDLRSLFYKAYPNVQQGTKEAEALAQTVLVNQFVAGLLPEIKSKLVGTEGNFSQLLAKARFKEAKLHHLGSGQSTAQKAAFGSSRSLDTPSQTHFRPSRFNARVRMGPRCYTCGYLSHLVKQCPYYTKQKYSETPGNRTGNATTVKETTTMNETRVAPNVTPVEELSDVSQAGILTGKTDINDVLDLVTVQMYGITSKPCAGSVRLGPVSTALVAVEGEFVEALLDTGSPVTIIQLESLLQILAKQRHPGQTPAEWRTAVESHLKPTSVILQNYSGDKLRVVRQIRVNMSRPGYSTSAVIQVQKGAPAKLLIGTDLLSQLGYLFIQSTDEDDCDMLTADSDDGLARSITTEQNDGVGSNSQGIGTVCLIQAARIPPRHKKMVRVQVTDNSYCSETLTMFELNSDILDKYQLLATNALTCLDHDSQFTLVLENHGCQPV